MGKLTHLISLFGLGCVAFSLLRWIATLPGLTGSVHFVYLLVLAAFLAAVLFERPIFTYLGVSRHVYLSLVVGLVGCAALGGVLIWLF